MSRQNVENTTKNETLTNELLIIYVQLFFAATHDS
jgi:hypothetical protein